MLSQGFAASTTLLLDCRLNERSVSSLNLATADSAIMTCTWWTWTSAPFDP